MQRHKQYYIKDSRSVLSILLLFNVIILVALGFIIMMLFIKNPTPIGFASNENKQIITQIALDKPSISPALLNNWLNEVVQLGFNFNYANQAAIAPKLKDYMSEQAIAVYNGLFEKNESLRQLVDKKLIVSVLARSAPTVDESGIVEGRYAQKITMEIELVYANIQSKKRERKQLVFLVLRVSELENPLGVTIYRFDVKDSKFSSANTN